MGFFEKLSNFFIRREDFIKWDINYMDNYVLLTPNIHIFDYPEIVDLINMNAIDRKGNTLFIPYEMLYDLYYDENGIEISSYEKFGLPPIFKGFLKMENKNNFIQDKEVIYQYDLEGLDGRYIIQKGNIVKSFITGKYRVLPAKAYDLIKQIDEYDSSKQRRSSVANQFEMLGIIKTYADEMDIVLNQRLAEENPPVIIEKIKIDFQDDEEVLEIFPRLSEDEEINKELLGKIYDYEDVKDFYSAEVDGKKIKFVIKHKDSLKNIINNRRNSGEQRLNFLSGTHPLMEDENIDISEFGPRVKGIGYLNYRSYSITTETSDIDWFEKDMELPHFYLGSERIVLKPEDEAMLKQKVVDMNIAGVDKIEMSFASESGDEFKTVLSKSDIKNEIHKLKSSMKNPWDITSQKAIKEILNKYRQSPDAPYIEYKGKYISTAYGKEAFYEQLRSLEDKKSKTKKGKKSLIIYGNIERKEFTEPEVEKVSTNEKAVELPSALKEGIKLFNYQQEGLERLQNMYRANPVNGFLLCDDMGLGKTLQLLSFMAWLKENGELKPSLVIAPSSLLNNWDNEDGTGEIQKFFGNGFFNTYKVRGRIPHMDIEILKEKDIVFTTYESLRMNSIPFGRIHWSCMICDEAQKVKSPRTLVTVAAKGQHANFKIVCSATPIENSLVDLWNLVDYSKPGILGSLNDFQKSYVKQVAGQSSEEDLKRVNDELYDRIKGYYMRREKDVLPKLLPKKRIKIYKKQANKFEIDIIDRLRKMEDNKLALIQKMLVASSHIDLISENDIHQMSPQTLIQRSSKLQIVKPILEEVRYKQEKAIIFTRSIKMQQILCKVLRYWFEMEVKVVNGRISDLRKRTDIIDGFRKKKGYNVIILSPDVAGFGLTLTEANHVIHYSRLWNPAREDQSTDRVYRIGQDKEVTVHYPMLSFGNNALEEYDNVEDYVNHYLSIKPSGASPEEKLNILLVRKKNMLMKFFLAVDSSEIRQEDFFGMDSGSESIQSITIDDIDKGIIDAYEFEALIALLFERQGYRTMLTTMSNDNGVDVVCLKGDEVLFVQCKKGKKVSGREAVKDLLYARELYKKNMGLRDARLVIATNSEDITKSNDYENIDILAGKQLRERLIQTPIYKDEVDIKNKDRYSFDSMRWELKDM
jgi:SNF2 family DNA or RNA helicase